jgi:hypothetical protein
MPSRPETTMARLKSAIISTVIWLACAIPLYGGLYACSAWLTPEPFATAAQCHRALAELQYSQGHHGEYCAELEKGGGSRLHMTLAQEPIAPFYPDWAVVS